MECGERLTAWCLAHNRGWKGWWLRWTLRAGRLATPARGPCLGGCWADQIAGEGQSFVPLFTLFSPLTDVPLPALGAPTWRGGRQACGPGCGYRFHSTLGLGPWNEDRGLGLGG